MAQYSSNSKGTANTHGRNGKFEEEYNRSGFAVDEIITKVETTRVVEHMQLSPPAALTEAYGAKAEPGKEYVIIKEQWQGKPEKNQPADEITEFIQHVHAVANSEPGATSAPFLKFHPAKPGGYTAASNTSPTARNRLVSGTTNNTGTAVTPYDGRNKPISGTNYDDRFGGWAKRNGVTAYGDRPISGTAYDDRPKPISGTTSDDRFGGWTKPNSGATSDDRLGGWTKQNGGTTYDDRFRGWTKPSGGTSYDDRSGGWTKPRTTYDDRSGGWTKPSGGTAYDDRSGGWTKPIGGTTYDDRSGGWTKPSGGTTYVDRSGGWTKPSGGTAYDDRTKPSGGTTYDDRSGGWTKPSGGRIRPTWAWTTPPISESSITRPTNNIDAIVNQVKEPPRPAAPAETRRPAVRFTPLSASDPAKETIDSKEAARRYNGLQVKVAPEETIDSQQAAQKYNGTVIAN